MNKKQKREVALAKRERFEAELKRTNAIALAKSRSPEEAKRLADEANAELARLAERKAQREAARARNQRKREAEAKLAKARAAAIAVHKASVKS